MMDLRERAKAEIMSLTEEECRLLLAAWHIQKQHPEWSVEECVKRAASGVTSTEGGKAEQINTAVSAFIVAK